MLKTWAKSLRDFGVVESFFALTFCGRSGLKTAMKKQTKRVPQKKGYVSGYTEMKNGYPVFIPSKAHVTAYMSKKSMPSENNSGSKRANAG